jgi:hypothetical protein
MALVRPGRARAILSWKKVPKTPKFMSVSHLKMVNDPYEPNPAQAPHRPPRGDVSITRERTSRSHKSERLDHTRGDARLEALFAIQHAAH